jgi:Protein of unknown function (DUF1565)
MRIASLTLVLVVAVAMSALHGCGGSSGAKPTPKCVLNSDCRMGSDGGSTLVCALGFCVSPCNSSEDCSSGQLCIKTDNGNACRAPEVPKGCVQNSDCTKLCTSANDDGGVATSADGGVVSACPIVCGRDQSCRTECVTDVDCPGGTLPDGSKGKQKCTVSGACIDPVIDMSIYDPTTNDFKASVSGAAGTTGAAGTAGTTGAGGSGIAGTTGIAGSGPAGTTGTAGTTTDGGIDAAAGTGAAGTTMDGGMNKDAAFMPMSVAVAPSDKVFQGQSGPLAATITITNPSGGLSNPIIVDFGGLQAFVTPGSSTDTSLLIRVSVPHGTTLGKRTLKVSTTSGLITAPDVVEVTAIYAGPNGLDTNVGSSASPFHTLKQALTVAASGDTIHLLDGTYSVGPTGEMWPYLLPANITITGDSTAGTILSGQGGSNINCFDASTALTVQTLTIKSFTNGVSLKMPTSTVTLTDVAIAGNSNAAIYLDTASAGSTVNFSGTNASISQPGMAYGVQFSSVNNATVNMTNGTVAAGSYVFYFVGVNNGTKLTVSGTKITQSSASSSYYAIYNSPYNSTTGVAISLTNATIAGTIYDYDGLSSLTITGSTINQANGAGDAINFYGKTLTISGNTAINMMNGASQTNMATAIDYHGITGNTSKMSLNGVTIMGGGTGILQDAAGNSAVLRSTTISGQYYHGYSITQGTLDLGKMNDPGLNAISLPGQPGNYYYYALNVAGTAGAGVVVTSFQTTIGGGDPGAMAQPVVIAPAGTTATTLGFRYNVTPGSMLTLY